MIAQAYNDVSAVSGIITSQMDPITTNVSSKSNWIDVSNIITEIKGPIKVGETEISNKLFELMIKDFLSTAKEKYPEEFLKE